MVLKLSMLFFFFFLISLSATHLAQAVDTQTTNNASYFTLLKNYLLSYIARENSHVLGAQIQPLVTPQISMLPVQESPQISMLPIQESPQLSFISSYLLQAVNAYRQSLGLYPVTSSLQTCAFAKTRAVEIANAFNHNGFYNRVADHTIPYTSWAHADENIAEAPSYQEVVTLWKNSPEHALNMRSNTPYVCIEEYDNYYAYEGMNP